MPVTAPAHEMLSNDEEEVGELGGGGSERGGFELIGFPLMSSVL